MAKHKWFFNFDGLRFFAALLVILTHIESIKKDFGFPSFYSLSFFTNAGPLAVTFFFVLSGFLIAYLLMHEQQNHESKINIFRFYQNRILRIWPLYYLLVLLSYLVLPYLQIFQLDDFNKGFLSTHINSFLLYLSFLPNYSNHEYGNVLYLGQIWSLGVEEFFYLFFPLGLYLIPQRKTLIFFITLIVASIAITALSKFWCDVNDPDLPLSCIYISRYRIYAFALGALSAFAYLYWQSKILQFIPKTRMKTISLFLFFAVLLLLFTGTDFAFLTHPIYSVLFALFLFLFAVSEIKMSFLNHPYIVYLGKISYGIYMLHPIAIVITIRLMNIKTGNDIIDVLLLDIAIIALVIAMSMLSYQFFEKVFLRMRK